VSDYGPDCPVDVDDVAMLHRWDRLSFLHWSYPPEIVQRLLPSWLEVDLFDGVAWVSLVPFYMRVWTPGHHQAPWACNFCETNVRTYVKDPDGRTGIWFFSLDAARLGAVVTAKGGFRLPYCWSDMSIVERPGSISYAARRRWPGPRGASSRVTIDIGPPYAPSDLESRDHFLTARWVMFSSSERRRRYARAWHEAWVLHRATVTEWSDELVAAAGLPSPSGEPLAHYSPGVDVKIGHPQRYPAGATYP
jgi:uncharacterized protein YqjF (DUF2071 family)